MNISSGLMVFRTTGWIKHVTLSAALLLSAAGVSASGGTVLYSQPSNGAGGYISQNSSGPANFVPATAYDNFNLSNDSVINEITWAGEHNLGTPIIASFTLQIYNDNAGAIGASIFSTVVTHFNETPLGTDALGVPYFSYDAAGFSTPMLTAGTQYWLSIVANTANAPPLWDWGFGSSGNGSFFYKFPDGSTTAISADLAFTLYMQTPPSISCAATPTILWPPNGKSVLVTVSGTIIPGSQPIPAGAITYVVIDGYRQDQPAGSVEPDAGGSYSFGVSLIASRKGNDQAGRTYTILVGARDSSGNVGTCSAVVTVPHDKGQ